MQTQPSVHIIDDDPSVRESLKSLIGNAGFDTHCYASAQSFLEHSERLHGCALVDLRMQGMDGLALQKELIARKAAVRVIMLSAYGDIAQAVSAMRLGAVDFIEKPFDPQQLLERLRRLSARGDEAEVWQSEARQHAALVGTLTPREKQVLRLIVDGWANKQVAAELCISARTVETHRVHIMQKLGAESLPHLVKIWLAAGSDVGTQDS